MKHMKGMKTANFMVFMPFMVKSDIFKVSIGQDSTGIARVQRT